MQELSNSNPLWDALVRAATTVRCPRCNEPIDFTLRYPNPHSASQDHILPKAVFGEGPKQWMHLVCNQRKGAKVEPMRIAKRIPLRKARRIPAPSLLEAARIVSRAR